MNIAAFGKFQPGPGFDTQKTVRPGHNGLNIEYYFNQDGYYEIVIIKQNGDLYIMDSSMNGIINRTTYTWNDLYSYLKSDWRLKFAAEYIDSHYYNYGTKRVLSRNNHKIKKNKKSKKSRSRSGSKKIEP